MIEIALITIKEYAEKHGKDPANIRQKANRGNFQTAVRMGRDWFIDEDEPFVDGRVKSGKCVNWRRKAANVPVDQLKENK